jgi:hypothetical protein
MIALGAAGAQEHQSLETGLKTVLGSQSNLLRISGLSVYPQGSEIHQSHPKERDMYTALSSACSFDIEAYVLSESTDTSVSNEVYP